MLLYNRIWENGDQIAVFRPYQMPEGNGATSGVVGLASGATGSGRGNSNESWSAYFNRLWSSTSGNIFRFSSPASWRNTSRAYRSSNMAYQSGNVGYYHHGIFNTINEVIHFQWVSDTDVYVHKVSLRSFACADLLYRVQHVSHRVKDPYQVVEDALEDCLGDAHRGTYDQAYKNCEHMANKWKTGESFSAQIEVGRDFLRNAGFVLSASATAGLLHR